MEPVSTLLEGERNFFSGTYSNEEADFMAKLLGNFSTKLPNISPFEGSPAFWPHQEPTMNTGKVDEASLYISDNTNTNMHCLLQDNSCTDGNSILFHTSSEENYLPTARLEGGRKSISVIPSLSSNTLMEGEEGTDVSAVKPSAENNLSPSSRKRSCSLEDVHESRKKTKFSMSQKLVPKGNIDGATRDVSCRQITNIYGSDDDSNGSQDVSPRLKGVEILNSNDKRRASVASATDSQSVYAKKRRERINERLRILQNLVPNGTKVDISTMLEEAVQYVKFLQLQIKLLSSDDLWMYAPIAYNGMDIGLDMKLPSPR